MKKDYQRTRVYDWQNAWVGGDPKGGDHLRPMKLHECEKLACEVAHDYPPMKTWGRRIVAMRAPNSSEIAWADGYDGCIHLPAWARKPWIVLHEAAHFAAGIEEGHGPKFVKVYIEMLADMLGFDEAYLRKAAKWWGVKVAP